MSKSTGRSRPRGYGLFTVGRNKASPARTASTKRASIRRSVIRTDATKHAFDPECADGEETSGNKLAMMVEHGHSLSTHAREIRPPNNIPSATDMKDAPLPPIPGDQWIYPLPPQPSSRMPQSTQQSATSRNTQRSATMPLQRSPAQEPNLFRRITSKFRSSPSQASTIPQRKNTVMRMPHMAQGPVPPKPVQSDFTSAEQRQAALRARGLVPATSAVQNRFRNADGFMMTLSEQEAEIDRRYTVAPGPPSSDDHSDSEATRIREAWLAKQTQASSPECEHTHEEASRKSDAMVRASKDGTVGDRSPIRATFVQVTTRTPTHGDVGEGTLATVEDFRTAPNPRQSADHASPLRSTSGSPEDETSPPVAVSLAGAARPRKEKPPPITVTSHRMSQEARAQQSITVAISAPSDTSTSDGRPQLEQRGRPTAGLHATSPPLGQASSTSSSDGARSRTTTVPALSPTRTVSSGADSSLPTPTTTSCFLGDSSVSHGSTSHSSDNGHETVHRPRRVVDELKAKRRTSGAGAVIMEEYSETDPSSEDGEFGMAVHASPTQETGAAAATAPRMRALDQSAAKQNNRKSFSLFGKKSLDVPRETRTASSMLNLRRAFTSAKPRPSSTVGAISPSEGSAEAGMGRKSSRTRLPPSPKFPPSSFPPSSMRPVNADATANSRRNSTGVGPRPPRQAVAPTMHSRGSILLQAHTIEDEESRRLSEMAFLT